ncbi:MAG TPA: ATP-binding protein [Pyrinomonadaceae bacterium]|nr:ATP-binding protein [Pyrinomonadaceae bacterium]
MSTRNKLLLVVLACGLVPALLLAAFAYRAGARAVEDSLRADAATSAAQLARQLEAQLRESSAPPETSAAPADFVGAASSERQRQAALLKPLASGVAAEGDGEIAGRGRQVFALAADGRIVYHANAAYMHRPAAEVAPHLEPVAREMAARRSGSQTFTDAPDGASWIAAYTPVAGTDISVAVARNRSAAVAPLRRTLLAWAAVAALAACGAGWYVYLMARRQSRVVASVAEAAARVAAGRLDESVELSGEGTALSLAENFNRMTDRLREQIRREAENRQFQSFFRLSAMLTHDLKNAITALSILVKNMERHLHREEFRADAIQSLRDATENLRSIVARLSEPAVTLSGEYRRSIRQTDLVPVLRRVVSAHAASGFHEIETDLPDALVATVDAERIERVLENLVINGLEAMGTERGRLTVAAGREDDSRIFLSVADTGAGMTEEFIRARLFRPFATTKAKGVGLGLYTCREVVEAHGGRIEVESEKGAGTRFRVVLPSDPSAGARTADAQKPG